MSIEKAISMIPLKKKLKNLRKFFTYDPSQFFIVPEDISEEIKKNMQQEQILTFYESMAYFGKQLANQLNPFGFALTYKLVKFSFEHNFDILSDKPLNLNYLPSDIPLKTIENFLPENFVKDVYRFLNKLNKSPLCSSPAQMPYKEYD